jgi:hypothetical protein
MARKSEPEFFVATTSGALKVKGKVETFIVGRTIVHRSSPLYQAHPDLFQPIERPAVEQATAAPGASR